MGDATDTIHVLHVDDEPSLTDLTATYLKREDERIDTYTATSPDEGLTILAEHDIDCVVSDYDMPRTDGIEFLEAVRGEYSDLPFILYTGKGSEEVASEAISAGVTGYLQKETGTSQYEILAHQISNAVESRRSEKKAKKTRLKKSKLEAKYRSITEDVLNATAVGTIVLDPDFEIVWCSQAIADFFGIDRSALIGTDTHDSLRKKIGPSMEDSEAFVDTVVEAYENNSYTDRFECHVLGGDERAERWLEYRSHPIETGLFEGGRVEIYTEVTDRVERKQELERTERWYRALMGHAHDAIARIKFDNNTPIIRETTPEFKSLFEPPDENVIGQDIDEVVASDEKFETAREISLRTKKGEPLRGETTRDTEDGPRDFIWQAVPIQDPETGAFDGGFAIYTDITEQRDREREIERYREFIKHSTDIVTLLNASGRIEFNSPAVEEILGYDQSELVGEDPLDHIHPEDRERVRETLDQAFAEPGVFRTAEFRFQHADGSWVWFESRGRNRLDDPNIEGVIVSQREITDRVEREQRLQRERDRLEEFASIVSHDLRNPLSVAEGRVKLAQQDCNSEHLDAAGAALARIDQVINRTLTLARSGQAVGETEPVDLSDLAEQCWENVDTADSNLRITDLPRIKADRNRLRHLFENLYRNSIEHGGEDVSIVVSDLPTHNGFYIEDNGPGIPENERKEVLTPGYSTTKDGTGLGLNIVKQIVEAHDWTIRVTESADGGARFEITGVTLGAE